MRTFTSCVVAGLSLLSGFVAAQPTTVKEQHPGHPFVALQKQIDVLKQQIAELQARQAGVQIIFRDSERQENVPPGERLIAAVGCLEDEVVISGGYIMRLEPQDVIVPVTLNAFFFDGTRSGWRVDLLNDRAVPINMGVRVNLACAKGIGIIGDQL